MNPLSTKKKELDTIITGRTFRDYLLANKNTDKYNLWGKKVISLLDFEKDSIKNFKTLQDHQSLVMLSKAPGCKKLQLNFAHQVQVKDLFLENERTRLFGLVGLGNRATGVKFPEKIYAVSQSRVVPKVEEIQKLKPSELLSTV